MILGFIFCQPSLQLGQCSTMWHLIDQINYLHEPYCIKLNNVQRCFDTHTIFRSLWHLVDSTNPMAVAVSVVGGKWLQYKSSQFETVEVLAGLQPSLQLDHCKNML